MLLKCTQIIKKNGVMQEVRWDSNGDEFENWPMMRTPCEVNNSIRFVYCSVRGAKEKLHYASSVACRWW